MLDGGDVRVDESDRSDESVERPASLADFNGQTSLKENLHVYLDSARRLSQPLDHVLFYGPPGLGKTTLARIVANELGVGFRSLHAPSVVKASDLVSTLVGLEERDVLFIDEVHRLPPAVEEVLYPVMEDYRLDVMVGEAGQAKAVSIPLPPFTLVGATTRPGSLTRPMRDRFGITFRLEMYTVDEMCGVIGRAADKLALPMEPEAVTEVARRSRGTPRIGLRLLRRVRDFAVSSDSPLVTGEMAGAILTRIGVDADGLDDADRRYLSCLRGRFKGGPVGLSLLASALSESPETLEHEIEPYLIAKGFIDRTGRGRVARTAQHDLFG